MYDREDTRRFLLARVNFTEKKGEYVACYEKIGDRAHLLLAAALVQLSIRRNARRKRRCADGHRVRRGARQRTHPKTALNDAPE